MSEWVMVRLVDTKSVSKREEPQFIVVALVSDKALERAVDRWKQDSEEDSTLLKPTSERLAIDTAVHAVMKRYPEHTDLSTGDWPVENLKDGEDRYSIADRYGVYDGVLVWFVKPPFPDDTCRI